MALVNHGFVLRAYNLDGTLLKERSFSGLPIRIGRNALNDFQLDSKTASNFHARIDYEHGRVRVYDLNSTNGVFTRIPDQRPAERVGEQGAEIAGPEIQIILGAQLWLSLYPAAKPVNERPAVRGSVLGNPAMLGAIAEADDSAAAAEGGASPAPSAASGGGPYAPPVWATPAPPPAAVSQPIHGMRSIDVGGPGKPAPSPDASGSPPPDRRAFEPAPPVPAAPAAANPMETLLSAGSASSPRRSDRWTAQPPAPGPAMAAAPSPSAPTAEPGGLPLPPAAAPAFEAVTPHQDQARHPFAERLPDGVRVPEIANREALPDFGRSLPDLAPSLPGLMNGPSR